MNIQSKDWDLSLPIAPPSSGGSEKQAGILKCVQKAIEATSCEVVASTSLIDKAEQSSSNPKIDQVVKKSVSFRDYTEGAFSRRSQASFTSPRLSKQLERAYLVYFEHLAKEEPEFLDMAIKHLEEKIEKDSPRFYTNRRKPVLSSTELGGSEIKSHPASTATEDPVMAFRKACGSLHNTSICNALKELLFDEEKDALKTYADLNELVSLLALSTPGRKGLGLRPKPIETYEGLQTEYDRLIEGLDPKNLQGIHALSMNDIDLGMIPQKVVENLSNLMVLTLENNPSFMRVIDSLKDCPKLIGLSLARNSITAKRAQELFPLIREMQYLKELDLRYNDVALEEIPEIVRHCKEKGINLLCHYETTSGKETLKFLIDLAQSSSELPELGWISIDAGEKSLLLSVEETKPFKGHKNITFNTLRYPIPDVMKDWCLDVEEVVIKESKDNDGATFQSMQTILAFPSLKKVDFSGAKLSYSQREEIEGVCKEKNIELILPVLRKKNPETKLRDILTHLKITVPEQVLSDEELISAVLAQKESLARRSLLTLPRISLALFPRELVSAFSNVMHLNLSGCYKEFEEEKSLPILTELLKLSKLTRVDFQKNFISLEVLSELSNFLKASKEPCLLSLENCTYSKEITQEMKDVFTQLLKDSRFGKKTP